VSRREDVDNSIWSDPDFYELSAAAKLVYLWSFTNQRCNMAGLYRVATGLICGETGLSEKRVQGALRELEDRRMVFYDGCVLWVRARVKHLRSHHDNIATSGAAVDTSKTNPAGPHRAIVESVERGFAADIQPQPWQTDTCIGNWHYDRPLYERGGYKSAKQVVQRLCDVVSKNGNLLLSIPQRGDGSIDEKEEAILDQLAAWFAVNGSAIYGTRPWRKFGEGPTRLPTGMQNEGEAKPFVAEDIRFTAARGALNAIFLDWPRGEADIRALGREALPDARIDRVEMLGGGAIPFRRDDNSLRVKLPPPSPGAFVPAVRILGTGLA
jgi:alpha-L-fucosidase